MGVAATSPNGFVVCTKKAIGKANSHGVWQVFQQSRESIPQPFPKRDFGMPCPGLSSYLTSDYFPLSANATWNYSGNLSGKC